MTNGLERLLTAARRGDRLVELLTQDVLVGEELYRALEDAITGPSTAPTPQPEPQPADGRKCRACGEVKPEGEYSRNGKGPMKTCKPCMSAKNKAAHRKRKAATKPTTEASVTNGREKPKAGRPAATQKARKPSRRVESPHAIRITCTECGATQSALAFPKTGDGRGSVCRNCQPHGRPIDELGGVA